MKKKILFVIGSLRKKSFNKQVAQYVESLIGDRAEVKYLHYSNVPLVNQDIEFPAPAEVARVREEVMTADVLWVFTPEYNYSYPAIVKNLFDWLSRPMNANDPDKHTAIEGKTVALTGIGGKNQTKDCREKLTALLDFLRARVLENQVGLMVNVEAWSDDVVRLTPEQEQLLKVQTEDVINNS